MRSTLSYALHLAHLGDGLPDVGLMLEQSIVERQEVLVHRAALGVVGLAQLGALSDGLVHVVTTVIDELVAALHNHVDGRGLGELLFCSSLGVVPHREGQSHELSERLRLELGHDVLRSGFG